MITLSDIKKHPEITKFIEQTEVTLAALSYTDHGFRHCDLVAERAKIIAKAIGLSKREEELAAIAGYCHDMANFLSRTYHNYFGSLLFHQVFKDEFSPKELVTIMQAISNHDKKVEDMNFANFISAIVVLADKSDVHRSRVIVKELKEIESDIHDRVNYATTMSSLRTDKNKKKIILTLKIDTDVVPIMEYFEIFTDRMVFCRRAAENLGYDFGLIINKFRLL
ncbi:MAG: HD domain-containing protein [Patescibacteria group bacterium]|nr:HD domain-containing protein [Patescibacteria group bacterium]